MNSSSSSIRLGLDIGGTFTDVALEIGDRRFTAKTLTTPGAPEALASHEVEAVAVGLLHSFTNPDHERRVGDAILRRLPHVAVTLSSDVSPEMREYERFSTACANAYIQPLMGRYLVKLEHELARAGFACPLL